MKLKLKLFKRKFVAEHIIPGDHIEIVSNSGIYKVISVIGNTMLLKSLRSGMEREYLITNYKCTLKRY